MNRAEFDLFMLFAMWGFEVAFAIVMGLLVGIAALRDGVQGSSAVLRGGATTLSICVVAYLLFRLGGAWSFTPA